MSNICYYVLKNRYVKNNSSAKPIYAIITRDTFEPYLYADSETFEGPFLNLNILKQNSKLIKELKITDPKQYAKIIRTENFINSKYLIEIPDGKTYSFDFVDLLEHGTKGSVKDSKSQGGHFYMPNNIRIIETLKVDVKGVLEAKIAIRNQNTDKWVSKEKETTLFPLSWDLQKYFDECDYTVKHKIKIGEYKFSSTTTCGIPVEIILKEGKLISIYPLLTLS
ncbi:EndoU domain-containing protein [Flavobacterium sp. D11R37]|uniref:EndoU domain-containing protein n=1 Tax=Flavobacterium coralii TaxID=2838017 RepID=UPI001CA7A005|nr:EndoU domain-containing protein [Flavobacterium coralii]MBY8963536.1 EndoU domain-containing protein [Flavobacterium coralii]